MLLPSKQHKEWHDEMYYTALSQTKERRIEKCTVTMLLWAPDKRAGDLSNKFESVADLLVDCEILVDDNWYVLSENNNRFMGVDKENPRVEILIEVGDSC